MLRSSLPRSRRRRGTVFAVTGISLIVVLGTLALVADGGLMLVARRRAQAVADAAALAAAYSLYSNYLVNQGTDPSPYYAKNAALAVAADNGYANDGSTSAVTVNIPPQSGLFKATNGYAEVIVQNNQPRLFSAIWGSASLSVTARSVARGIWVPASKAALLVLDKTGSSLTLSGTPTLTAVNGNIVVDSTSSAAVLSSGTASLTAPELDLSGNILYSGHNPDNATVTKYSQPYTADPLASLAAPSTAALATQSNSTIVLSNSQTMTLNPGVYNGGFLMSGSASLTLNPGVYYINGGGINMSGQSSITGSGVFIYNTGGGAINISGGGTINLSPMTSGTYTGVTIFQDRNSTVAATLAGRSNIANSGTFYFPDAMVNLVGNSGTATMGGQYIAKDITVSGTAGVKVNYDGSVARTGYRGIVE